MIDPRTLNSGDIVWHGTLSCGMLDLKKCKVISINLDKEGCGILKLKVLNAGDNQPETTIEKKRNVCIMWGEPLFSGTLEDDEKQAILDWNIQVDNKTAKIQEHIERLKQEKRNLKGLKKKGA